MKRLLSVVFAICAPVVLAFTLASQVAMADCDEYIADWDAGTHTDIFCSLMGHDDVWCYYACSCFGPSDEACAELYSRNGVERVPDFN